MRSGTDPTVGEIARIVQSHLSVHKHVQEKSGPHAIADCIFCGKQKHLYVNLENGAWDCKVCNESGGFWKLADQLGIRVRSSSVVRSPASVMLAGRANAQTGGSVLPPRPVADGPHLNMAKVTASCELVFSDNPDGLKVLEYLRKRGLNDETIRRFKLGLTYMQDRDERGKSTSEPAVGIPYIEEGKVPMMKMRNLASEKDKRKFMRTKGGNSSLFNVDAIRGAKRAVLVEGEFDAISLHQVGITTVASTSLGAKKNISAEWMTALESVDEIVLWYDADEAGQDAVHYLTRDLGTWRVKLASIDEQTAQYVQRKTGKRPKDVNDLLVAGVDHAAIRAIVDAALPIDNTLIVTADRYSDPLAAVIDKAEESLGQSTGLEILDNTVRGWRTSELILVTGHTSHGKSTFMQDRLEWLAQEHNEPVLLTALENGPLALARKMFQRRFGGPISGIKSDADKTRAFEVINTINKNPIYILDVYGRCPLGQLVDAVTYSRRRYGTRRIMIDHLGFIQPRDTRKDEREAMDDILMELVELTRKLDCTIFMVAHPRGSVEQSEIPTGDSIKGTSSAKQLCDGGISVWRNTNNAGDSTVRKLKLRDSMGTRLEVDIGGDESLCYVWKVRHDEGINGHGVLRFNARRLTYEERPSPSTANDPRLPREEEAQQMAMVDPFAE